MNTITFTDAFGYQHTIESNMPEKFAKREAEAYLYAIGQDCPAVSNLQIS